MTINGHFPIIPLKNCAFLKMWSILLDPKHSVKERLHCISMCIIKSRFENAFVTFKWVKFKKKKKILILRNSYLNTCNTHKTN